MTVSETGNQPIERERPRLRVDAATDAPSATREPALATAGIAALTLYAAAAAWIFAHPVAISSDDALYFSRSLTRFSILDFSPQFPGYPGFVAIGRLALALVGDPLQALALVTGTIALALPPLSAIVVWKVTRNRWRALAAFLLALANPLLPDLALNLLSDGAGILFLLVFLALLPEGGTDRPWRDGVPAGLAIGLAAACRPSDIPLLAGAFLGMALLRPRLILPVAASGSAVGLVALAAMVAHDGLLYFTDGLRFMDGHALQWGNTIFTDGGRRTGWITAIDELRGGLLLAAVMLVAVVAATVARWRSPAVTAAAGGFAAHATFVAVFQNPDHLRHLAPLAVLAGLLAVLAPSPASRFRGVTVTAILVTEIAVLVLNTVPATDRLAPLAAIAHQFRSPATGSAVATREGVFALRMLVPSVRVYDMHYPADAALGLAIAGGPAYRITTTAPRRLKTPPTIFRGRFPGEETLWLTPFR